MPEPGVPIGRRILVRTQSDTAWRLNFAQSAFEKHRHTASLRTMSRIMAMWIMASVVAGKRS